MRRRWALADGRQSFSLGTSLHLATLCSVTADQPAALLAHRHGHLSLCIRLLALPLGCRVVQRQPASICADILSVHYLLWTVLFVWFLEPRFSGVLIEPPDCPPYACCSHISLSLILHASAAASSCHACLPWHNASTVFWHALRSRLL